MDNSSILISVIIVLCIAAGVTAYGLTNDSNTVFNDLAGFTPDSSGDTGIGNNTTDGNGSSIGTEGSGGTETSTGTAYSSSSSSSSSSSYSSSSSGGHNISPDRAKKIAEGAAWPGAVCYSVEYNSGGYYTCLLKDDKGNTGYVLVGSGTGRILEGAWSGEATGDDTSTDDTSDDTTEDTNTTDDVTNDTNSTE